MRRFRDKTGRLGSLVSLLLLTTMLVLFAVNFPVFLSSTSGQVFAGFWVVFALVMFSSHIVRLSAQRQRPLPVAALKPGPKDARTRKNDRMVRAARG